jgi:hypothetical protein
MSINKTGSGRLSKSGSKAPQAKLSAEDIYAICKAVLCEDESKSAVAIRYCVHVKTIYAIFSGQSYFSEMLVAKRRLRLEGLLK